MTLHEFIAARLDEEPNADQLVREAFRTLYSNAEANPRMYGSDAPWTYAERNHLASFALRWVDHPDYSPELHGQLHHPLRGDE